MLKLILLHNINFCRIRCWATEERIFRNSIWRLHSSSPNTISRMFNTTKWLSNLEQIFIDHRVIAWLSLYNSMMFRNIFLVLSSKFESISTNILGPLPKLMIFGKQHLIDFLINNFRLKFFFCNFLLFLADSDTYFWIFHLRFNQYFIKFHCKLYQISAFIVRKMYFYR